MEQLMLVLLAATAAYQLYALARLRAPKMQGATGKFRRQPDAAATAVVTAVVILFIVGIGMAGVLQSDWRVALILWTGSLLFLLMGTIMAFDGVRYGPEGFAMRDYLGRVRTYRWADVLAVEQLIIPPRGRGFDTEITAVYLPDRTLTLRRTLEGTELPFLELLRENRPDLPDKNPDGRRFFSDKLQLMYSTVIELFLLAMAISVPELSARYGWIRIVPVLWAVYFVLQIVAVCNPQRFSAKMREKLLGPEPRRKK